MTIQQLPPYYFITPEPPSDPAKFLLKLEQVLAQGTNLLVLRAKHLTVKDYAQLAQQVRQLSYKYNARLLLHQHKEVVNLVQADGLHLSSQALMQLQIRPIDKSLLCAASCHNAQEIKQAAQLELDFVTLSPVKATQSHPETSPLGWLQFAKRCQKVPKQLAVYALGGLTQDDLAKAQSHGAVGIAGIRAFLQH